MYKAWANVSGASKYEARSESGKGPFDTPCGLLSLHVNQYGQSKDLCVDRHVVRSFSYYVTTANNRQLVFPTFGLKASPSVMSARTTDD